MRAQRLLSILMHLQVNRRMTACDLARKLEVSERTILRDMDALHFWRPRGRRPRCRRRLEPVGRI
jgi:predicted DNA-binding transcriptional regulator YafY